MHGRLRGELATTGATLANGLSYPEYLGLCACTEVTIMRLTEELRGEL